MAVCNVSSLTIPARQTIPVFSSYTAQAMGTAVELVQKTKIS